MKVKALKFTKITNFTEISVFFTEKGQFQGKCHGRDIVNSVGPYTSAISAHNDVRSSYKLAVGAVKSRSGRECHKTSYFRKFVFVSSDLLRLV